MENATKALLISAGIMLAVMIISLMLVIYNQISSYYAAQHEEKEIEQLKDFNEIFENYHRDKIRGSDMISLMNRIIDYNERQAYEENKQYPRMRVTIDLGSHIDEFKFPGDLTTPNVLPVGGVITNKTAGDQRTEDKKLIAVTEIENVLRSNNAAFNLTSTKLQQLSADISNIVIDSVYETEDSVTADNIREKRQNILKSILGRTTDFNAQEINTLKDIACQYYEFTQFKRALFNCTEVIYDQATGRICEMNFEVYTKNNMVVFN